MDDRLLGRCLDGEVEPGDLPGRVRRRAERWEGVFRALRDGLPDRAPVGLVDRVTARIRAEEGERDACPGDAIARDEPSACPR